MAEAADADDQCGGPRWQAGQRALDRVVRVQRRVRQRGGGDRVEVADGDGESIRHHDKLGQTAVTPDARGGAARDVPPLAEVLLTAAAAGAAAAAPGAVDDHGLADLDVVDAVGDRGHRPGDLVAEREGQVIRDGAGRPVQQVQVGVAQPRAGDAQQHLPGPGLGLGHVPELGRRLPSEHLDCAHRELLSYRAVKPPSTA